jgi:hypothetical protein
MKRAGLAVLLLSAMRLRAADCAPMRPWEVFIAYVGSSTGCTPATPHCYAGESIGFMPAGNVFECQPTTWQWQFGDGTPAVNQRGVTHRFSSPGTYTVTLQVTQPSQTFTLSQTVQVEACACPACPLLTTSNVYVTFTGSQSGCTPATAAACRAGELITFRLATLAYDFSCSTHELNWQFGDGATASGLEVSHAFASAGGLYVSLTIRNPQQTMTLGTMVEVTASNQRRRSARH